MEIAVKLPFWEGRWRGGTSFVQVVGVISVDFENDPKRYAQIKITVIDFNRLKRYDCIYM